MVYSIFTTLFDLDHSPGPFLKKLYYRFPFLNHDHFPGPEGSSGSSGVHLDGKSTPKSESRRHSARTLEEAHLKIDTEDNL